mmetsp:Transcript_15132/g.23763  ORF Transcript_15132/g.23763 Transcript_15132/m.23763 type:complete len:245 (-) Transcript_15132:259-993(-)
MHAFLVSRISVRTCQGHPSQKCLGRKGEHDEAEFSNEIVPEHSNLLPLQEKANGEGEIEQEEGKDDGADKRGGFSARDSGEEVTEDDRPRSQVRDVAETYRQPVLWVSIGTSFGIESLVHNCKEQRRTRHDVNGVNEMNVSYTGDLGYEGSHKSSGERILNPAEWTLMAFDVPLVFLTKRGKQTADVIDSRQKNENASVPSDRIGADQVSFGFCIFILAENEFVSCGEIRIYVPAQIHLAGKRK